MTEVEEAIALGALGEIFIHLSQQDVMNVDEWLSICVRHGLMHFVTYTGPCGPECMCRDEGVEVGTEGVCARTSDLGTRAIRHVKQFGSETH